MLSIESADHELHGFFKLFPTCKATSSKYDFWKYFNITRKPAIAAPLPTFAKTKKSHLTWSIIYTKWTNFILVTVRSKEMWLVEENYATVKPDSSVASREMKTYSESRIELRIYKS